MTNIYGCIGEKLSHSFSKEIHNALADYEYQIIEVKRESLEEFMLSRQFQAINVTIPYKELVIPYLHEIDESAKRIGAVNTIVNRGGLLYGYNTDFYGLEKLISHLGAPIAGNRVAILGTGGTSKTAKAVCTALGASQIVTVSRRSTDDSISYDELYESYSDIDVIINTTPVGMYPNSEHAPIALERFTTLSAVIDAIYNPLRSNLVLSARARGIKAEGGLYMLVAQAVRASEIFLDKKYPTETIDRIYRKIYSEKENIVLIGMPSCGKSTVGALVARALMREHIDTDSLIERTAEMKISDIFSLRGEKEFRDIEESAIREAANHSGAVISTGGGAILREENIHRLKRNGRLYFIDMPLDRLTPTSDRPLALSREAIVARHNERYPLYLEYADCRICVKADADSVKEEILGEFKK